MNTTTHAEGRLAGTMLQANWARRRTTEELQRFIVNRLERL